MSDKSAEDNQDETKAEETSNRHKKLSREDTHRRYDNG